MMNQETRRLNTTEVVLPQEVHQDPTALLPALMPSSPSGLAGGALHAGPGPP